MVVMANKQRLTAAKSGRTDVNDSPTACGGFPAAAKSGRTGGNDSLIARSGSLLISVLSVYLLCSCRSGQQFHISGMMLSDTTISSRVESIEFSSKDSIRYFNYVIDWQKIADFRLKYAICDSILSEEIADAMKPIIKRNFRHKQVFFDSNKVAAVSVEVAGDSIKMAVDIKNIANDKIINKTIPIEAKSEKKLTLCDRIKSLGDSVFYLVCSVFAAFIVIMIIRYLLKKR
jgi:predicted RNA binding protein with dsRBD fold (UPF0201 family)